MDFSFTEEQILIRNSIREYVEKEIKPHAAEVDLNHRVPVECIPQMAELGLFSIGVPEEFGGMGASAITYALITEEFAKVSVAHGMLFGVHCSLGMPPILNFGQKELVQRLLPDMLTGKKLAVFCLTEPSAGSDSSAQKTTAVKDGDFYVLNGSKAFISNAPQAGLFVVFAMTDPSLKTKGISAFVVEKGTPGLSIGKPEDKMGTCGSDTCEVFFKDCRIPAQNLLGAEGQGFKIAMTTLDGGRFGTAAGSVGLAQGALDAAIAYTKERVQFGMPIAANQGIQWILADMAVRVETARLLAYRAAWAKDMKEPSTKISSMAKLYATETAMFVTHKAVQLHGGMGYMKSYPVERMMREAKLQEIFEGTSEIQRSVIAREILK